MNCELRQFVSFCRAALQQRVSDVPRAGDVSEARAFGPGPAATTAKTPSRTTPVALAFGLLLSTFTGNASESMNFRTDILPILTKAGCNTGACHGAATGQGGFKLSLLGYDPEQDYLTITRELGGRRIDLAVPENSLFLRKPTRELDHDGGLRIQRSSGAYRKLIDWLASGADYGSRDLAVTELRIEPDDTLLTSPEQQVQLKITARLSNGTVDDVTELALYTSNDDTVADVDKRGLVTIRIPGATSIMVRYSGEVAAARVSMPFSSANLTKADFQPHNKIDDLVWAELQRLRIPPSPLSDDAEFLRRVYLDVIGRLPQPDDIREFLAEPPSRAKRERVIDQLLDRKEFVDFWTMKFADLLLMSGKGGSAEATQTYHRWLRQRIAANAPWNQIVREIITAKGRMTESGPANFFALAADPRDLAEHVGSMFLGAQIACARCHAHPADRWTQTDYHRFAAYFARVTRDGGVVKTDGRGEVNDPKTNLPVAPKPLGAAAPEIGASDDPRLQLADWMTAPENPHFARAFVNRVWQQLLGRGLIEPVDDLRPTNPPANPALLDVLAGHFVSQQFDLRWLVREIVTSRTYQLSSRTNPVNRHDDRFFSHAYLKPLPAQVFVDAIAQVTAVPDEYDGYPDGTRAVELVGAQAPSYALDVLGRCSRERSCESGARSGGGLAQALHLINGSIINDKLRGGILVQLEKRANAAIVEELYLRALSRLPEADELAHWESMLAGTTARREILEDLLWGLLNSREFAFNH